MKRAFTFLAFLFLVLGSIPSHARHIKVATYNVQNLFDLGREGTEYEEYIPDNPFGWNKKTAEIKYRNISRVIKDMAPDIVGLQEIESSRALILLRDRIRQRGLDYPYSEIADSRPTAVKCAILSRFPIVWKKEIRVHRPGARNILAVKVRIDDKILYIYVNHWKSKHGPESERIACAKALRKAIDRLPKGSDFIILGDFNSNYNEFRTISRHPELNDTKGITGINHVLLTIKDGRMVTEKDLRADLSTRYLYNLWLELPPHRRWSYYLFGRKGTPDSIIIPAALYDNHGFSYVDDSFDKFAPRYLFRHHAIFQWQRANFGRGRHLGLGYSDHLPLYAYFSTTVR
ncbi:MAG TPA: endonuclease [Desulfobacteraceae bacterium]|nr:endonuclease/exonuclease/phosphatase family protein [Deltaproteobacteria bacterium]HDM09098.1 endonuclease [Desulfobacteraceae bacterium]